MGEGCEAINGAVRTHIVFIKFAVLYDCSSQDPQTIEIVASKITDDRS